MNPDSAEDLLVTDSRGGLLRLVDKGKLRAVPAAPRLRSSTGPAVTYSSA